MCSPVIDRQAAVVTYNANIRNLKVLGTYRIRTGKYHVYNVKTDVVSDGVYVYFDRLKTYLQSA